MGCILFSDRVEKFISPGKGRTHFLHIIREILEWEPRHDGTDIGEALRYLTNAIKKKCTAFVLSDMLDVQADGTPRYEEALKVAVNRHDVSVIRVSDPREKDLPNVGLVHAKDAETGASRWINTGSRSVRNAYSQWFQTTTDQADRLLMKYQVDHVDIATQEDYVRGLMNLFHRR